MLRRDLAFWIADAARNRIFLHAGAVAVDGRALLLPGRSGAGKSTLVEALLRAGAQYLSDEYAPLDRRGRVHPFPIPLDLAARGEHAAADLGATSVTRPLPVVGVVVCRYRAGARWQPRRLSPGQGLLRVMQSAVPARRYPERTLETLSAVLGQASVLVGTRGEATECAGRLIECFAGRGGALKQVS